MSVDNVETPASNSTKNGGDSRTKITQKDIAEARKFLLEKFSIESNKKAPADLINLFFNHAHRVSHIAHDVGVVDGLNPLELEFAAMVENIGKVNSANPNGLGTLHNILVDGVTNVKNNLLMVRLHKAPALIDKIIRMICCHYSTPLVCDKFKHIYKPKEREEIALLEANMLDTIDAWGMCDAVVLYVQENNLSDTNTEGFKRAWQLVIAQRNACLIHLKTPLTKSFEHNGDRFIKFITTRNVKTLQELKAAADEFHNVEGECTAKSDRKNFYKSFTNLFDEALKNKKT